MTKDEARTRSLMRYIGTQVGSGGTREEAEGKVSAYCDGFDAGYEAAIAAERSRLVAALKHSIRLNGAGFDDDNDEEYL